jgi:hypothetical protein
MSGSESKKQEKKKQKEKHLGQQHKPMSVDQEGQFKNIRRLKQHRLTHGLQIPYLPPKTSRRKRRNASVTRKKRLLLPKSLKHPVRLNPKKRRRKRKGEGRWNKPQKILSHPQLLPKLPLYLFQIPKSLLRLAPLQPMQKLPHSLRSTQ